MADEEFLTPVTDNDGLGINLATPPLEVLLTPNIGVIGVGGAGGNAVNNMIQEGLGSVSFFAANTDAQALSRSLVAEKIQMGAAVTKGLGAGANPEVGRAAAEESIDRIKEALSGLHLLFITAGMGGGTGTGASPVVARIAKEMGILTVGVVSKPFNFEGPKRMKTAEQGIVELQKYVDTLVVVPNQNLYRIAGETMTFASAFKIADNVLCQGVRSITDLVMKPGLINLDFADVETVLSNMGRAMMGTGEAIGENRALEAAEAAISNPLLDTSIKGAKSILLNISGGMDLTVVEVDAAAERIRSEVDPDATIIFGAILDEELAGKVRVSLVATGIDEFTGRAEIIVETPKLPEEKRVEITPDVLANSENKPETELPPEIIQPDLMDVQSTSDPVLVKPIETVPEIIPDLEIKLDNMPIQPQNPLFEEVPPVVKTVPVIDVPEVRPEVNIEPKRVMENVRPARSGFVDSISHILGKKRSMRPNKKTNALEPPLFDDESIPSFLRR